MSSETVDRIFGVYFRWFARIVCFAGIVGLILHFSGYGGAEMFNCVCFFGSAYALVAFGFLAEIATEALRKRSKPKDDDGWDNDNWWMPPEDDPPPDRSQHLSRKRPRRAPVHGRRVREHVSLPLQE